MRRVNVLSRIPALLLMGAASFGCNPIDADGTNDPSAKANPAAQRALSVVGTARAHQVAERGGERVVYHPGWASRIEVMNPGGDRNMIYGQSQPYDGFAPGEVALGFSDAALALFDPFHCVRQITIETLNGQTWSFHAGSRVTASAAPTLSLAPPSDAVRLALAPAERARAGVATGPEHRVLSTAGEQVTYHPGWVSRIRRVDARGSAKDVYRMAQPFTGAHPTEVVLGFGGIAITVFDPEHEIIRMTVEGVDGESFEVDDRIRIVTPPPPPPPPTSSGGGGSSW